MMLKSALALSALLATASAAPAADVLKNVKANVTQDFEHAASSDSECGVPDSCPNNVPGKSQALLWSNIIDEFETMTGSGNVAFETAYTGYFYRRLNGTAAAPSSATANYAGSRVVSFALSSLALGCYAQTNYTGLPGTPPGSTVAVTAAANCTLRVDGYKLAFAPGLKPDVSTSLDYVFTGPSQTNLQGLPVFGMTGFELPAKYAGLRTVTFTALSAKGAKYFNLVADIDTVKYVTTNATSV